MLLALAVVPAVDPSWPTLAAAAVVLAAWALAGRVPRGAWPRLPPWLLLVVAEAPHSPCSATNPTGLGARVHRQPRRPEPGGAVPRDHADLADRLDDPGLDHTDQRDPAAAATSHHLGPAVRLPLARLSAAIALGLRLAPMLLDDSRTILHLLGQRRRSSRAIVSPGDSA